MQFQALRKNTNLEADDKPLEFKDGVATVKEKTKDIQALIKAGYIKEVKDETTSK